MRAGRIGLLGWVMAGTLSAGVANAAPTDCAVDFDGDGVWVRAADWATFIGQWTTGNSNADLNGDLVVDNFDLNTFFAYSGMAVCPWRADYQYNRGIDPVDTFFFQTHFAAGSLRADMDGDGATTPADLAAFMGVYGTFY